MAASKVYYISFDYDHQNTHELNSNKMKSSSKQLGTINTLEEKMILTLFFWI